MRFIYPGSSQYAGKFYVEGFEAYPGLRHLGSGAEGLEAPYKLSDRATHVE